MRLTRPLSCESKRGNFTFYRVVLDGKSQVSSHQNVVRRNIKALKMCDFNLLINGCLLSLFTMNVSMACHTYFLVWFLLV